MNIDLSTMQSSAREASTMLKALANENRLMILCQLIGGEMTVGELTARIGLSQSAMSQHLAVLRRDALVEPRGEAQTIHYALADQRAAQVIQLLYDIYCSTKAGPCGPQEGTTPHE
ncbi:MAG: helix-turn-helix transcriptional regulator [Rhodospirillaceae bacterium]|nr:helix-turn-helix transcriptional regulator [Rhodospirillaceae bacterium]